MRLYNKLRLTLLVLPLLLFSSEALGDTLTVTSGQVTFQGGTSLVNFSFNGTTTSGSSVQLQGTTSSSSSISPIHGTFMAGTSVNLTSLLFSDTGFGTATIDGVTTNRIFFGGTTSFNAGSVFLPLTPDTSTITLTAPFTYSGIIAGVAGPNQDAPPLFSYTMIGNGTVTATFVYVYFPEGPGSYSVVGLQYNTTAPVPEPTTMLLLGTGMAGVAAKFRKRRKAYEGKEA